MKINLLVEPDEFMTILTALKFLANDCGARAVDHFKRVQLDEYRECAARKTEILMLKNRLDNDAMKQHFKEQMDD